MWAISLAATCYVLSSLYIANSVEALSIPNDSSATLPAVKHRVAIVGGGVSGLVVGHVLSQSGAYDVHLFEKASVVGGNVRSVPDPIPVLSSSSSDERTQNGGERRNMLNIGHASHMGMFWNLRLMLEYLHIEEWPVGRGSNSVPGLFRMLSINREGNVVQPPLQDVLSPLIWFEAFKFYFYSYLEPEIGLDAFLQAQTFSDRFQSILFWAMATFEFDKTVDEAGEYAVGAARALLITQIFFKFLLCDEFNGVLPSKIDSGLKDELIGRIKRNIIPSEMVAKLVKRIETGQGRLFDAPLASYFTADYTAAMNKLADGIEGSVNMNCAVSKVMRHGDSSTDKLVLCTNDGKSVEVDSVVFTTQPSIISNILSDDDFSSHLEALYAIESGAVGVQICHEKDLPFSYPPDRTKTICGFDARDSPVILGVFDISQLTIHETGGPGRNSDGHYSGIESKELQAGWLSIAYPVYRGKVLNRHENFLANTDCVDKTIYPWIRATSSYPAIRRELEDLQGLGGIYITGHAFTGINKASELQVTNALKLCHEHFDALPPWGEYIGTPLLPDCNDEDAFKKASSVFEAISLAWKSLVGSFLLLGVVSKLGIDKFE